MQTPQRYPTNNQILVVENPAVPVPNDFPSPFISVLNAG